jgi:molecular chaperone DnaJ
MCTGCDGEGSTTTPCMSCNGTGSVHQQVRENISIPKGIDSGVNLRMAKKGNYSTRATNKVLGDPGDLLIKVTVRPHPYYRRDGANIYTDKFITVT